MLIHLDGKLVPRDQARVSVFDRGFLFGDGIYEGLRSFEGRVVGMDRHIARMRDGLAECRIPWDAARMAVLTDELLRANGLRDAFIYWQVTRGVPAEGQPVRARIATGEITPTVMGFCYPTPALDSHTQPASKRVITTPDTRWLRGAVKSISLLGGVLGAIEAHEAGTEDAIFIRNGLAAEGTSANLFIATTDSAGGMRLATPSLQSAPLLAGVTRDLLLEAMPEIEVRAVTRKQLTDASEVMLVGTLTMVTTVVEIDGRPVGGGTPGPAARRMLDVLVKAIRREAGTRSAVPTAV